MCVKRLAAASLSLLVLGCGGSDLVAVKGKVTYKGKPLNRGTVMFIPESGGATASGDIQPDGSFELTTQGQGNGAAVGVYAIEITVPDKPQVALPEDEPPPSIGIPAKYGNRKTSGLQREVQAGENEINIDLGTAQ